MASRPFEAQLSKALADDVFPGAVLRAKSKDGRIDYTKNIGPWDITTIFQLMSMTKLVTSVAAAKAIELGLITLDAEIDPILPTLAAQPILKGFDADGEPILEKRRKPLTLRHLLTHSYGQTYSFFEAGDTARYLQHRGITPSFPSGARPVEETYDYPLLAEPGDVWNYSPGIDWAGRAVEVVSGETLEAFLRARVFAPLGIGADATFFPARRPGALARTAAVSMRDEATGRSVPAPPEAIDMDPAEVRYCMGGSGLWASVDDYFRLVESLMLDDERVLKRDTAALLFEPQLRLNGEEVDRVPVPDGRVGWVPELAEGYYSWTLAGLLTPAGHGHRGKGFLQWGGMCNSSWVSEHDGAE